MVWQSRSINLSRSDTYHIYWIATVALLPRDDKESAGGVPQDDKEKTANVAVEFSKTAPVMPFLQLV